jgi:hypothetical protein
VSATRTRRLAAAAATATGAVVGAALLAGAPQAAADPVPDAAAALRVSQVYVAPGVTAVKLDSGLAGALPTDVKIAVLPDSAGSANTLATEIGRDLGTGPRRPLTIAVVTVGAGLRIMMRAASSKYCPGLADAQARDAASAARAQLQSSGDLTPVIQDFVQRLSEARIDRGDCAGDASGAASGDTSSSATAWVWIAGIAVICALGIGGLMRYRRRSKQREIDLARAMVMPYYDRLANEINTLDPTGNAQAQQALADAAQRFTSAGSQLAGAGSVDKYGVAQRTVLEGLHAARTARAALGRDPGPPLPPPDSSAHEQLREPQQVSVQGQRYQGYPNYTPAAPYYFAGGYGVPGGWYGVPFWETLLLGSVLSGGLFGYGYDGFGADYEAGYDAGQDCANADVGAGGDFGGGADFGGDGGGGDFS